MDTRTKFLEDFNALLEKYDAEITCDDHFDGYPERVQVLGITIEFKDYKIKDINFYSFIDSDVIKRYIKEE